VTSSHFCLYLLNIYHFTYTFSRRMHIQRHTHTSTHVQSAHKRNGDTFHSHGGYLQLQPRDRKRLPAGHRSLVERGGRKALLETLHTKKKCQKKPIFTNLKKEHIELPAKLLDYFLRSNKSNINQPECCSHFPQLLVWERKKKLKLGLKLGKELKRFLHKYGHICVGIFSTPSPTSPRYTAVTSTKNELQF